MECSKCKKEILNVDIPDYTNLGVLVKEKNSYFLCKICRKPLEEEHKDIPAIQLITQVDRLLSEGATVYVKFTCHNCGSRQTSSVPNTFHTHGYNCEECSKVSFPSKFGFSTIMSVGGVK
tara:strand:+ start:4767 stop:5126 length:360 start_codon:yes stop_codon:yes gene_type:complete